MEAQPAFRAGESTSPVCGSVQLRRDGLPRPSPCGRPVSPAASPDCGAGAGQTGRPWPRGRTRAHRCSGRQEGREPRGSNGAVLQHRAQHGTDGDLEYDAAGHTRRRSRLPYAVRRCLRSWEHTAERNAGASPFANPRSVATSQGLQAMATCRACARACAGASSAAISEPELPPRSRRSTRGRAARAPSRSPRA